MNRRRLFLIPLLLALFFAAAPAYAQAPAGPRCQYQTVERDGAKTVQVTVLDEQCKRDAASGFFIRSAACKCCGDCGLPDFVALAVEGTKFIFGIAGSLALLMVVLGGFRWLTAAGRSESVEKGKKTLTYAVTGLLIVFGAWALVNTILATLTGRIGEAGAARVFDGSWATNWATQKNEPERAPASGGATPP